jgi:hypothetical protein
MCESRLVVLVHVVCLGCLVERDYSGEQNGPDGPGKLFLPSKISVGSNLSMPTDATHFKILSPNMIECHDFKGFWLQVPGFELAIRCAPRTRNEELETSPKEYDHAT